MKELRVTGVLIAFMILFAAARCVDGLGNSGPMTLTQGTAQLESILDEIAYTSPDIDGNNKAVIYQISFRGCPPCIQSHENILPQLQDAGVETRLVTTARRHQSSAKERAAVVENIRRRDWSFTQMWWAERHPRRFYAQTDLPPVEGDAAREADLQALQSHVDALAQLMALNGHIFGYPALIWKSAGGQYKAAVGYNPNLAVRILSDIEDT